MRKIRVLEADVVDRIAAGEVVERPASVVKELMENALDAGAGRIDVELRGGGRELVEVLDDGHGMDTTDAELAFTQHATSKIGGIDDLDHIVTLGFRGEALASIAAVARVEMETGTGEGPGTRLRIEGAGEARREAVAAPRGTRVRVRDLFFNTPARAKHLRTDATELARAAELVVEFALLRPDVHIRLLSDGRERLDAPPVKDVRTRVHQVLGADVADAWLSVEDSGGRIAVRGGITDPRVTRADRRGIHIFVNGRAVADARLAHAVVSAYATTLDRGRAPLAALFLQMPPEDVDVNVHPRKAEVRFVEPGRVFAALRSAVARTLAAQSVPLPLRPARQPFERPSVVAERPSEASARGPSLPMPEWRPVAGGTTASTPPPAATIAGTRGTLQPLAQYGNTYIVAADEDGLLIVDQHVAHERVLYERILAQRAGRSLPVQRLLVAETVELDVAESAAAEEHAEMLATFGFEIEPFGSGTWAIRTVPELLGQRRAEPTVRELLAQLGRTGAPEVLERLQHDIAASIACHAAVRANQPLSAEVMSQLLAQLAQCEAPTRCPHGRPVLIRVERSELERQLKRH